MSSTKYYFEDGTTREYRCRIIAGSESAIAVPTVVGRVATSGWAELWTPGSSSTATSSGLLDRVLACDRPLCDEPMTCDNFCVVAPEKPIVVSARRDADADVVLKPVPGTSTFGLAYSDNSHLLVVGNAIHAPLGYHISCEHGVPNRAAQAFQIGVARINRTTEEDDANTKRNVEVLNGALAPSSATRSQPDRDTSEPNATPTTNSAKYYFEDGTVQECKSRTVVGLTGTIATPIQIRRSSTDNRTELWTWCENNEIVPSIPKPGCLDRVWVCDRLLCYKPTICSAYQITIPASGRIVVVSARRDADADAVLGTDSRASLSETVCLANPALFVEEKTIHAPLGHHLVCNDWASSERHHPAPEFRARTAGVDDEDARQNAEILSVALMSPPTQTR